MIKKYKLLYSLLLISLVGTMVTVSRWKAWFYIPPEQSYAVPQTPDRITLTYGEDALTERTLTWRCDTILQKSYVQITKGSGGDTLTIPANGAMAYSRHGRQAFYSLHMTNVKPDNEYSYRVMTGDKSSPWFHFSTSMPAHKLNFLLFGDVQDGPGGNSRRVFMQALTRFPHAQFWAYVGDAIERPEDVYWNIFFKAIDSVEGRVPLMVCTGNHEYLKGLYNRLDSRWTHTFIYPANGDVGHRGTDYYIDFPLLRYVVLDTEGMHTILDYYYVRHWLDNVLSTNTRRWTIVMMHHPVYSAALNRSNLLLKWFIRPVLEKYKVDMVVAGHDHCYMRRNTDDTTPVYIDCNSSDKFYLSNCNLEAARICCAHCMYHYVEMTDSTLLLKSYVSDRNRLYDDAVICKSNDKNHVRVISHVDRISELLDIPPHTDKSNLKVFLRMRERRIRHAAHATRNAFQISPRR